MSRGPKVRPLYVRGGRHVATCLMNLYMSIHRSWTVKYYSFCKSESQNSTLILTTVPFSRN